MILGAGMMRAAGARRALVLAPLRFSCLAAVRYTYLSSGGEKETP